VPAEAPPANSHRSPLIRSGTHRWGPDGIYIRRRPENVRHLFPPNPPTKPSKKLSAPDHMASFVLFLFSGLQTRGLPVRTRKSVCGDLFLKRRAVAEQEVDRHGDQLKGFTLARREVIPGNRRTERPSRESFTSRRLLSKIKNIHCGSSTAPDGEWIRRCEPDLTIRSSLRSQRALVLRPNYRGSAGYGEKFRALNVRNLGVGIMPT